MSRLYLTVLMTRNETDVCENGFPSFKHKFQECNLSRIFIRFINNIARPFDNTKQVFCSVPDCQTCMCKRGIRVWGKPAASGGKCVCGADLPYK